jgi:hypothetical protein
VYAHPLLNNYGALVPIAAVPSFSGPPPSLERIGALTRVRPAGQAVTSAPAGSCPACPHCATLPSAQSAHAAISDGGLNNWLRVGRDMILRGVLIWTGIVAYDVLSGHKNPWRLQYAVAGAAGIEVFVLLWTAFTQPKDSSPAP